MLRSVSCLFAALLVMGCDRPDENRLAIVLADEDVLPIQDVPQQLASLSADMPAASESVRDPFQWAETGSLQASQTRIHEILEAHALETLSLVGVLLDAKNSLALVKSHQGLHALQIGQHIGLHEGWVVRILHDQIEIQEPAGLGGQGSIQHLIMRASK